MASALKYIGVALAWILGVDCVALSQSASNESSSVSSDFPAAEWNAADSRIVVKLGLAAHWKVGQVCPIYVAFKLDSEIPASDTVVIEIDSLDGDGVGVTYKQQLSNSAANSTGGLIEGWVSVQIGRANSPIDVRCIVSGKLYEKTTIYPDEQGQSLPATQPWIVAIGDSLGVEQASRKSTGDGLANFSTSIISEASGLPDNWRAYIGCDLLVIACNNPAFLRQISSNQWLAIDQWIQYGGNCLLSMGEGAEKLQDLATLQKLLPGTLAGFVTRSNPGPLESFVSTDAPVRPFGSNRILVERGVINLSLADESNKRFPWWVRYSHGLGYMQFVASDLSNPQLSEWKDRRLLWDKIFATCWELNQRSSSNNSADLGSSSYLGYEDIVGQLRATLDYFPAARVLSFGELTMILVVILLLIGPVDYFLSVRWLKRPYLSWWFAGSVVAISSASLIWANKSFRPDRVLVNSLEVLDVDLDSAVARGIVWSHVYRPHASRMDIDFLPSRGSAENRTDWQGLPGRGLGGLESSIATDSGMPSYTIDLGRGSNGTVEGIGIPAAGTKCLQTSWLESIPLVSHSRLSEPSGVNQIEGTLANPLDVDLMDAVLIYRNWFYRLPTRMTPGQSMEITFDMIPKDLPRWLNRRSLVDGSEQATRWNPSDRLSPGRLMEMLLFYRAAGGSSYVSLQHRFQPQVDFSKLINLDRAVLIGRLEKSLGELQIRGNEATEIAHELRQTWCRVVIPVAQTNRR